MMTPAQVEWPRRASLEVGELQEVCCGQQWEVQVQRPWGVVLPDWLTRQKLKCLEGRRWGVVAVVGWGQVAQTVHACVCAHACVRYVHVCMSVCVLNTLGSVQM